MQGIFRSSATCRSRCCDTRTSRSSTTCRREVDDGVVTLTGKVTMPYKSNDIEKRVAKLTGVKQVSNRIEVLPVSQFDDELRFGIARAIYGNSNFWGYGSMVNPPIHIIVEHGHVTLEGVVNSNVDRMLARSIASRSTPSTTFSRDEQPEDRRRESKGGAARQI